MNTSPKISVCIASYQHARYLPACLDSILAQSCQDFEIVIVDDGSTDGSHEILLGYQERYPEKIDYTWHPGRTNLGYMVTSNAALRRSRGEYIAWIGSDDLWAPEKLALQAAMLDERPELGMIYSFASFIDGEGSALDGLYGVDITADPNPVEQMLWSCHPPAMTVMVRRACLDQVGEFDESLVYSDWDLMIRCFAHHQAGFQPLPLAHYRIHSHNLSKGIQPQTDLKRILDVLEAVRRKATQIGGALVRPDNLAQVELHLSFLYFCSGREAEAVDSLNRAFEKDSTLQGDAERLERWLSRWKPDFYTPEMRHFGFWAIENLPPVCSQNICNELFARQLAAEETRSFYIRRGLQWVRESKRRARLFYDLPQGMEVGAFQVGVLREVYAKLLFESYHRGDIPAAKRFWVQAVLANPSWLRNRGIWSIGLRSLLVKG